MAEIGKAPGVTPLNYVNPATVVNVSLATRQPGAEHVITGLLAGEAIQAGDACFIKSTDGRIWRSTGAAANAAAVVDGWAAENVIPGEAISLYKNVNFNYSAAGLTPGTFYYLSGTVVGGIADAASLGGTAPIARSLDASRLFVKTSF